MKIFKILFLTLFLALMIPAQVGLDRASTISENFFQSRSNNLYLLDDVQIISDGDNSLMYVFILNPVGFIIVSGNDAAMPILGYSFANEFRQDSMPIQLDLLFSEYQNDIKELHNNNSNPTNAIRSEWEKYSAPFMHEPNRSVQPLLSCNWDQGTPWNDMCPEDSNGPGGNVLVGCVAVSMAQVMYYWGYPEIGSGDHAYNHWTYGYQYADFSDAFYDYENMADNYGTDATALLLYHAGVSVNMGYGVDGSGAQVFGGNPSTYYAMRNYFLFKNSINQIFPEDYSTSVYRAMLQEDLDNNRPIIYVGYSNDGGHAWNIDGYDEDYFHCNWGWGGYQNGYFLLSALNGFNSGQGAIINIEPQSLDAPNLVLTSNSYYEMEGDGDQVINPGETVGIEITVENFIPWDDAQNINLILEPFSSSLTLSNEDVYIPQIQSGDSYSNSENPFILTIPDDNEIGVETLTLHITATGPTGEDFYQDFDIELLVTLDQAGFPVDSDGTVKSAPLIVDIDGDSQLEMIYGDNNGRINILDQNGNNSFSSDFPYDLGDAIWGGAASADIDLDGNLDFVIASKDNFLYAFDKYGLKWMYNAGKYILATPSIGNLDEDDELEIVFGSYGPGTSENYIFAINHDGTDLDSFPYMIDEKIKVGVALADFNSNQKDDIVFGTDSDNLYLLLDNASVAEGFPFIAEDKIQSPPSILEVLNDKRIFFGSRDDKMYSLDSSGNQIFSFETDGNIFSSPTFSKDTFGQTAVFFGSSDGNVYALNLDGDLISGWPVNIGNEVIGSVLFEDINGDSELEVISFSNSAVHLNSLDGSSFGLGSIASDIQITSSSIVFDIDQDGDMEIFSGNGMGMLGIDIKQESSASNSSTNVFRFNNQRTGYFQFDELGLIGDLNQDYIIDVLDIVQLINIVLENIEPDLFQLWSGDINSDGAYDVLDVVLLVNLVLAR